mmetsp:Transcript_31228/g.36789  ORF Transcript_31228/g.36789 Transcript_31228/m.36789 type:complete len:224 (+) Transcript_31228:158-829(+)
MDVEKQREEDYVNMLPLEFAEKKSKSADVWDFICCCCSKVGSLIVICEAPRKPGQRRSLWCVVGPYWSMMLCCTTPLIAVPCVFTLIFISTRVPIYLTVIFALASFIVLCALWKTATTDPGLIIRRDENPTGNTKSKKWSWEDRTQTWRPVTARYADDCGVLVDEYDHTCPWTGTAIGKGNIRYFYLFTGGLIPLVILLVICVFVGLATEESRQNEQANSKDE